MRYLVAVALLLSQGATRVVANEAACVKSAVLHWTPPAIAPRKTAAEVKRDNADRLTAYIDEAVEKGARLVVTPEMSLVGYPDKRDFRDRAEAAPFAEPVPGPGGAIDAKASPSVARFAELAERKRAFLHIGMLERDGDRLYNVVVVFGPDGKIAAKHRKVNLLDLPPYGNEKKYLAAGTTATTYDAASIGLGKVGIAICADIYHDDVMGAGERIVERHLMERYRADAEVSAVAVSAAWATDSDPEKGPTEGWKAWQFFQEASAYVNNDAYLPSKTRYEKSAPYHAHPTRQVSLLVSNTSHYGPGAGIFHGSKRELASRKTKGDDGIALACLPGKPVRGAGATESSGTHGARK